MEKLSCARYHFHTYRERLALKTKSYCFSLQLSSALILLTLLC